MFFMWHDVLACVKMWIRGEQRHKNEKNIDIIYDGVTLDSDSDNEYSGSAIT